MSERPTHDAPDPLAHLGPMLGCALLAAFIAGVLYLAAASTMEVYRAAHGDAGVPGTVTIEGLVNGNHGDRHCEGVFVPDGGGPEERAFVKIGGPCTEGETVEARLTQSVVPIVGKYWTPTAWGEDSKEWIARVIVLVIVAIVAVPLALFFGLGAIALLLAFLRDLVRLAASG
jgi:hypothetical protein